MIDPRNSNGAAIACDDESPVVSERLPPAAVVVDAAATAAREIGSLRDFLRFVRDNANWLGAGVLVAFASCFGQTFVLSVLADRIMRDFGLSTTGWATMYMIGTLGTAAAMVWAGALTDRLRVRVLGTATLGGLTMACLAMAVNPFVLGLPVIVFALRFFGIGMGTHIAAVAMTRWFVASRGKALAVSMLGYAIGEALLPVSMVALADAVGWRAVWGIAALVVLALTPVLWVLLKTERTPQSIALETPVAGIGNRHWRRREVLARWQFWLILPALLLPWACVTSFFFHQVHLADVRGWSHLRLVTLFPVYTASWIAAMAVAGWAVDRLGASRLMGWYPLCYTAGFAAIGLTGSLGGAAVGLMLIGFGAGAHATVPTVYWAEAFGTRYLGSVKAMIAAFMVFGSALGPWISGTLIDAGYDFGRQTVWIAVFFLIAAGLSGLATAALRRTC